MAPYDQSIACRPEKLSFWMLTEALASPQPLVQYNDGIQEGVGQADSVANVPKAIS
jgi:hypothetical protein